MRTAPHKHLKPHSSKLFIRNLPSFTHSVSNLKTRACRDNERRAQTSMNNQRSNTRPDPHLPRWRYSDTLRLPIESNAKHLALTTLSNMTPLTPHHSCPTAPSYPIIVRADQWQNPLATTSSMPWGTDRRVRMSSLTRCRVCSPMLHPLARQQRSARKVVSSACVYDEGRHGSPRRTLATSARPRPMARTQPCTRAREAERGP